MVEERKRVLGEQRKILREEAMGWTALADVGDSGGEEEEKKGKKRKTQKKKEGSVGTDDEEEKPKKKKKVRLSLSYCIVERVDC